MHFLFAGGGGVPCAGMWVVPLGDPSPEAHLAVGLAGEGHLLEALYLEGAGEKKGLNLPKGSGNERLTFGT